MPLIKQVL